MQRTLGRYVSEPRRGFPIRRYLARGFSNNSAKKVCFYYQSNRISYAQIYPFLYHAEQLQRRYDIEMRFVLIDSVLDGDAPTIEGVDVIFVQPWFEVEEERLKALLDRLRAQNPKADINFIDSYAPNDLRLARVVDPYIRYYLKKSLLKDRALYQQPHRGDSHMEGYYLDRFAMEEPARDWQVPESVLPKLRLSPNFFGSPGLVFSFAGQSAPSIDKKRFDVHARIATKGSPWYSAMRHDAADAIAKVKVQSVVMGANAPWKQYMAEMKASKVCFSPFGYGELCWRDIEAFAVGAVLLKPDMGHLESLPDLYVPGETYEPTAWDYSDLSEKLTRLLDEPRRRRMLVTNAFAKVKSYLEEERFVDDMGFLFQ